MPWASVAKLMAKSAIEERAGVRIVTETERMESVRLSREMMEVKRCGSLGS